MAKGVVCQTWRWGDRRRLAAVGRGSCRWDSFFPASIHPCGDPTPILSPMTPAAPHRRPGFMLKPLDMVAVLNRHASSPFIHPTTVACVTGPGGELVPGIGRGRASGDRPWPGGAPPVAKHARTPAGTPDPLPTADLCWRRTPWTKGCSS